MIEEKGEKLEFLEKDLFLDREQEDISLWKEESMLLGEPGSDGLIPSSQVYTDTDSEDAYDQEDLQLLLRKASRYMDEGDTDTARELYQLALEMNSDCGEAWLGLLQLRWDELWEEDPDTPFFEDDDAWEYFEGACTHLDNPGSNGQFRIIADKGFSLGMKEIRRETENGTDFSDYDIYGPDGYFAERMAMLALDGNQSVFEDFLHTYQENHELYLQLQNLKETGPVSMIHKDPEYRECQEKYEAAEKNYSKIGSDTSYIGWGHIFLAAFVAILSYLFSEQGYEIVSFSIHLVPFLTAMIVVTAVDVIYKLSYADGFWEQAGVSALPAIGVYVVFQIILWFFAKSVDPTVPFSCVFFGVCVVLALAVIIGTIIFMFVSFWSALIVGGIAYGILSGIVDGLNIDAFPEYVLYQIMVPYFWLMTALCVGTAVVLFLRKRKASQSVAAVNSAKQQLDEATAKRDRCYNEKMQQLRAPFEGHVAAHHLDELVWKE